MKLHPAVEDCLIFGVPDERFGQRGRPSCHLLVLESPVPDEESSWARRVRTSGFVQTAAPDHHR